MAFPAFHFPGLPSLFVTTAALIRLVGALDPACSPGGNFDLSIWNLQLPIGSPGHPTTKSPNDLQGCGGWEDPAYFFTDSGDGALVMKVPGSPASSGCVTTPNSKHCRTEFRETAPSSWNPAAGYNRLKATLSVPQPDNSGTCVGQIHIDDSISSKPVCELFYNANGQLRMGVEQTRAGGDMLLTDIAQVPVGNVFTYEIRYESNVLSVTITHGNTVTGPIVLSTYSLNAPLSYFKVGNYNQGDTPSTVRFYAISVQHGSVAPTPSATPTSTPTAPCDSSQPTKKNDNTVTVKLFNEDTCCHAVETSSIGVWNVCHNSNQPFSALEQAVGQNVFNHGIKIFTYAQRDCGGQQFPSASGLSLTNSGACHKPGTSTAAGQFLSYMIVEPS